MADIVINADSANNYDAQTMVHDMAKEVFQQMTNPLEGLFEVERVAGREISLPLWKGLASSQISPDLDAARDVAPVNVDLERLKGRWNPYQLAFRIGFGQSIAAQASFAKHVMKQIKGVAARDGFQLFVDACNQVPLTKTASLKDSDLPAFQIGDDVSWALSNAPDPLSGGRTGTTAVDTSTGVTGTGTITKWNDQRLELVLEECEQNHLMSGGNPVVISNVRALGGFGEDPATRNKDYTNPMRSKGVLRNGMVGRAMDFGGLDWCWVGALPRNKGFKKNTRNSYRHFVVDRECMTLLVPDGLPRYQMWIFDDPKTQSQWYIFVENQGAIIRNPQGMGVINVGQ